MSPVLAKTIQFFIGLSILIVIHEFGHYMFARLFKTHVEKFYLFFDFFFPFPTLMNFALFKKKKGETEYGLGWFPLGGYVKIAGMVDESMDKEALKLPPQPWEYRSKKSYQKLLIMLGGIIMNIVLAVGIYIFVFAKYGEAYLPAKNASYGIACDSMATALGLQDGDKILAVGNKPLEKLDYVIQDIVLTDAKTLQIDRNGENITLNIPEGSIKNILKAKNKQDLIMPRIPFQVYEVDGKSPNKDILKKGDRLLAMNELPVMYIHEFHRNAKKIITVSKEEKYPISLKVLRNGDTTKLDGFLTATGKLGVILMPADSLLKFETKEYNFFQAVPRGFAFTGQKLVEYMQQLKLLFTSKEVKVSENVGGFLSIGNLFPEELNLFKFLQLTAFLSIVLAFMNLLPIPGLDGGYVLFLIFEMITGIKVKDSVIEKANTVGLVILLALMIYVNGLDVFRHFFK
ncbi:MAG: RIP metalloprotease RseP [Chitinophagaceae bacterium]|nr:RIP metalloprotease RseP [Chitinophagaceae bacterium]